MSRIVQAVNSMIAHQEKISSVLEWPDYSWLLFLYDGKHKWAMRKADDDYSLVYLKSTLKLEDLADEANFDREPSIYYRTRELGTKEALVSFRELYQVLQEKALGIEEALNEIIGDVPNF